MTYQKKRYTMLALLLIVGGIFAATYIVQSRAQQTPVTDIRRTSNDQYVSSIKPTVKEVDTYTVDPDMPKYISIPAIKLQQTRIKTLGLAKNNEIATPGNVFDAGWYNDSSKPGQEGTMFIYGHLSSWTEKGVFYNLNKLRPGDLVTIVRGDNKVFTYKVDRSVQYKAEAVDMSEVLGDQQTQSLSLMTCSGSLIKGTNDFTHRLVVFTSLVE